MSGRMYLTANVCELPRHDATVSGDLREILHDLEAHGGGVVLWQELGNDVYRRDLRTVFPSHYDHLGLDTSTPITYDARLFDVAEQGEELLHEPHAKLQKARKITWARLVRRTTATPNLIVSSRHYIARAWAPDGTSRPRADHQEAVEQPERQAIWRLGHQRDMALIDEWSKAGLTQVHGGDYNRSRITAVPDHVAGHRVQHVEHGLDWLHFIDGAERRWQFSERHIAIRTHSDHEAVGQRTPMTTARRIGLVG